MNEKTTDRQNRRGWELYRQTLEKRPLHRDFDGTVDGHVANVIAAYTEDGLSESEREVFEREMANSPDLLNTMIATRWGQVEPGHTAEVAPPAELVAWAKTLNPAAATAAPKRAKPQRGAFGWLFRPGVIVATATVLLALVGAVSVYVTRDDGTKIANLEPKNTPPAAKPAGDPNGKTGNSIFTDPKKVFFDGLDLD